MQERSTTDARWWLGIVIAVGRRPSLWPSALRQVARLAPTGWWRRRPHLPVPSPAYLAFRMETQYGAGTAPDPDDVITYLRWCRAVGHLR